MHRRRRSTVKQTDGAPSENDRRVVEENGNVERAAIFSVSYRVVSCTRLARRERYAWDYP